MLITFYGGSDTYKTGVTSPAYAINRALIVATGGTYGAMVSFDGGTSGAAPAIPGVPTTIAGAKIAPASVITVKNLVSGSNFTRLDITLWPEKDS